MKEDVTGRFRFDAARRPQPPIGYKAAGLTQRGARRGNEQANEWARARPQPSAPSCHRASSPRGQCGAPPSLARAVRCAVPLPHSTSIPFQNMRLTKHTKNRSEPVVASTVTRLK